MSASERTSYTATVASELTELLPLPHQRRFTFECTQKVQGIHTLEARHSAGTDWQ